MRVSPAGGAPVKAAAAIFLVLAFALLVQACGIIGGGGDNLNPNAGSAVRPSSIPTATPPATLPEPILLGAATDPGLNTTNAQGTPTSGSNAGSAATYTVKPGDTLAAIATSQGVTGPDQAAWIAEVLRLNNIADARLLAAGQELSLPRPTTATTNTTPRAGTTTTTGATPTRPSGTPGAGSTPSATPRSGTTPSTGGSDTYTVVAGDSPNGIASKLNVPAAQQQAWVLQMLQMNNTTAQTLQIGQTLKLPPIPR